MCLLLEPGDDYSASLFESRFEPPSEVEGCPPYVHNAPKISLAVVAMLLINPPSSSEVEFGMDAPL